MSASNHTTYQYDAFISYSRKDKLFAQKLEKALKNYSPPKKLNLPKRHLNIFRDEEDMVGTEYKESIDKLLQGSAKLIVLCSPNSRYSEYVNDEIRWFAKYRTTENIVPVIIAGIPDNEAKHYQESEKAFPSALLEAMDMPLAKDYRDFNINKNRVNKSPFEYAWYGLLSEIYGISRREIEERDKKKRVRLRAIQTGIALAFVAATILTILFAIRQYNEQHISRSREIATQAITALETEPTLSFRLAKAALDVKPTLEAQIALFRIFDRALCFCSQVFEGHIGPVTDASFSPDGKTIVTASYGSTTRLWDVASGKELLRVGEDETKHAAFSRDGTQIVTITRRDRYHHLWDATTGQILRKWDRGEEVRAEKEIHQITGYTLLNRKKFDEVSPDGTHRLEIKGNDVLLYNSAFLATFGEEPHFRLVGHKEEVTAARFSPDSSQIVTASLDRTARLWHVPVPLKYINMKPANTLRASENEARFKYETLKTGGYNIISVTDTVNKIKAQSQGGTIQILDVSSSKVLHTLIGHTGTVQNIMFSPDGNLLVTACLYGLSAGEFDTSTRVWDVATGKEIRRFLGTCYVESGFGRFSNDGSRLFLDAQGGPWDLPMTWQEVLRTISEDKVRGVPRTLKKEERTMYGIE